MFHLSTLARVSRHERLRRVFALADQGLQGLGNLVVSVLLGRALQPDQFGVVGAAVGAYYAAAGFHRSGVVLPFIAETGFTREQLDDRHRSYSAWWWLSLAAAIMLSLLSFISAALLMAIGGEALWLAQALALCGLMLPPMLAAEFGRRWFFKIGRADLAALLSLCFFVVLLALGAATAYWHPNTGAASAIWAVAGLAASLFTVVALRPSPPVRGDIWSICRANYRFGIWQSINNLPYTIYSTATVVLPIGALLGSSSSAIFTAARTLANPAVSIASAVDSTDKPRAANALAERGVPGLRRSVSNTRWTLVALTGFYLGLIALFAGPLVQKVFRGMYPGIELQVRLLCVSFFLFCLNQPSETLLIALRASREMLATRVTVAIATLIALIAAVPYGVTGMTVAIIISQVISVTLLRVAENVALRRYQLRQDRRISGVVTSVGDRA